MTGKIDVNLPNSLAPEEISAFCRELHGLPTADEYTVNFGRQRFISPFAMLLLASHLRQFREDRKDSKCTAINYEAHTYAAHMGLFKAFGLDHGNAPGEAAGSSTYLPITFLDANEITAAARAKGVNPGVIIEGRANELAQMLTRSYQGDLVDTLTFSIREIIRNVIEHSEAPRAAFCAQYWPVMSRVEVAIADSGRGIRAGLSDNDRHEYGSDREAVQVAMMPGVSGNIAAGRGGDDQWQNSGYGLYMTSRICRQAGTFSLYSGEAGLKLGQNSKLDIPSRLRGTAVQMVMDTRMVRGIADKLIQFSREGEQAARRMAGTVQISASTASQMLSRNFQV